MNSTHIRPMPKREYDLSEVALRRRVVDMMKRHAVKSGYKSRPCPCDRCKRALAALDAWRDRGERCEEEDDDTGASPGDLAVDA